MEKLKTALAYCFLAAVIAAWVLVMMWSGHHNRYHNGGRFRPKFSTYCLRVLHLCK